MKQQQLLQQQQQQQQQKQQNNTTKFNSDEVSKYQNQSRKKSRLRLD